MTTTQKHDWVYNKELEQGLNQRVASMGGSGIGPAKAYYLADESTQTVVTPTSLRELANVDLINWGSISRIVEQLTGAAKRIEELEAQHTEFARLDQELKTLGVSNKMVARAGEVLAEAARAQKMYPPYNSLHEAHSVIEEEFDEFWDEVKKGGSGTGKRDLAKVKKELTQLAATCLRTLHDLF